MNYKTCENCGCRVYSHGCVNCDEMEYISMQEGYRPFEKDNSIKLRCSRFVGALNEPHAKCEKCGKEEWEHKI